MRHVFRRCLVLTALCVLASVSSSARADFRSADPAEWARNRCVARNVMVLGVLSAPIGITMATRDDRLGVGATLAAASGIALATGLTLRIRQPESPRGVNSAYAEWSRDGCLLRTAAVYGGPVIALGAMILLSSRSDAQRMFGRTVTGIMAGTGIVVMGLGVTMTLYGAIRVRRRDGQPALDLGAPLLAVPTSSGSLAIGLGSLGFSGTF